MMSKFYDRFHRWEPLAEFNFNIGSEEDEFGNNKYIYCLCSRVFIRNGVKTYQWEKEDASESENEPLRDSQSQELDEHSHVHFSLDTSNKIKCDKDEEASCYCSASHTENCCSTDDQDLAHIYGTSSHALQPSDSGADLTYQDCQSDYTTHDKKHKMDQDFSEDSHENYLSEDTWDKFWAVNGERIIWASWIKKYSDYINPAYLDDKNELAMDENHVPKQHSTEQIFKPTNENDESMRERKFSYDSKVNPYKKTQSHPEDKASKQTQQSTYKDDCFIPIGRRRSCSEHDRILSPRTIAGTDSMTNVTKLTLSSYDVTSSRVTSDSSPTDDYSVSSTTSDDQSNDQTRIVNIEETTDLVPPEEMDTEQYWQLLWKKHFGEQYALHYANYIEEFNSRYLPDINIETIEVKEKIEKLDIECDNSEGNSQEITVIEVETQVKKIKSENSIPKRKKNKKSSKVMGSVGVLLQNLLKEEHKKSENDEMVDAGDSQKDTTDTVVHTESVADSSDSVSIQQPVSHSFTSYSYDDGDDDPPEEIPVRPLKRSHEVDEEEIASEKIKNTFKLMGFSIHPDKLPKGKLMFRKRLARLRPPRYKRFATNKKTYFDYDGNPCQLEQNKDSQDEREMQTDEEYPEVKSDIEKQTESEEADSSKELTDTLSDAAGKETEANNTQDNSELKNDGTTGRSMEKKYRRQNRARYLRSEEEDAELPLQFKNDPVMIKYWKKRHSLFHKFDEGIRLDRESWFSVTPERVAAHVARKCAVPVVVDAFCGAGGNTIQFARTCKRVIAIDIDPVKIELAMHNAAVYGVADRIEFMCGDFFELAPTLQADLVFLSPPWGGPGYSLIREYDVETMLEPKPLSELMAVARRISSYITAFLPRNSRPDQILSLAKENTTAIELEQSYLDNKLIGIMAYFI